MERESGGGVDVVAGVGSSVLGIGVGVVGVAGEIDVRVDDETVVVVVSESDKRPGVVVAGKCVAGGEDRGNGSLVEAGKAIHSSVERKRVRHHKRTASPRYLSSPRDFLGGGWWYPSILGDR